MAEKVSDEVIEAILSEGPPEGSYWEHYKGDRYVVVATALEETSLLPVVVYRPLIGDAVWVRSLEAWNASVPTSGGQVPRF
jgi:hypothetical protein